MSGRSRSRSLLTAVILLAGAVTAAPALSQKTPKAGEIPENLQARHRKFLEEVAPLIRAEEREVFLSLAKDYQRDAFIRRFWEVRDPHPQTARNEFRERWEERLGLARERFGGVDEDRARMLLWNGPPKATFQAQCDALLPLEVWSYDGTDRLKGSFTLIFVSPQGSLRGPFRLWYPSQGIQALLAPEARVRVQDEGGLESAIDRCVRAGEVVGAIGLAADWGLVEEKVQLAPDPGDEWLATFQARSTDLPEGAQPFPAQVDVSFPGRYGSRTVVQTLVTVPRQEVRPERLKDSSSYNFVVDGEILYRDELFEQFRYRFQFPEGEAQATLPMAFQRYLRPGSYTLVLRIEDTGGRRFYREQRELEIPAVTETATAAAPGAPSVAPAPTAAAGPGNSAASALAEANTPSFGSDEQTLRIIAPPPGLVTGKVRLEAQASGEGIAKVSFLLNGKPVLTKSRPPYSVELNLGDAPKIHTLQAVALAADGREVAQDQILLNSGPHRFSVRLVEPQQGKMYQSSLRAQAQVDVPEGERLDRVEIWLNETLVATLFQPPFVQPVLLPPNAGLSYVRAVAYLKDGNSTEDTAVFNAPDIDTVEVDFVELYTTVSDNKGRPVEDLAEKDFTVLEDGVPQEVRRFEMVRDLPIYAGILLDTSSSMGERDGRKLDEAVAAGLRFFETVIQPKDRAAVFTFNDTASLAVRFTNQIDVLSAGLNGLTAEGNTALYDSLVYTLYYFGGIKGKKAVVLLSDGQDSGSHYGFNEALEYARRSGVSIYSVGIDLPGRDVDIRAKLARLADETGGRSFFITSAGELGRVFETVETELRSQYLLAYQSSKQGSDDKFRTVEVKVSRPGLEAKTIRGYYP